MSTLTFGQFYKYQNYQNYSDFSEKSDVFMSMNYGTKTNSVGIDVAYSKDKTIGFGAGVSLSFNSPSHNGTEFTDNAFSWWQITKTETGPTFSLYGLCGYEYKKIKVFGKLGIGCYETVKSYTSTASNTQWYKVVDRSNETLLGLNVSYKVDKSWYLDTGFDNFNGTTFGLSYIF